MALEVCVAKLRGGNKPSAPVFITDSSLWGILHLGGMWEFGKRLLWSNAVISLGAAACVLGTLHGVAPEEDLDSPHFWFAAGIGAATWLAYTLQRHIKSTRDGGLRPVHLSWHTRNSPRIRWGVLALLPLSSVPLTMTAEALWTGEIPVLTGLDALMMAAILLSVGITGLYAGMPGQRGMRHALRRLPGMKMVWIGTSWASITALWPAWWMASGQLDIDSSLSMFLERFLVITALTLPFDLRDRNWDQAYMRTWPQLLDTSGTRILGTAFLLAAAGLRFHLNPDGAMGEWIGLLPMAIAVGAAREDRPLAYYGLIDALLILS